MKIGYSCWGFLGKGIIDTPDGGRSHRPALIKELSKKSQVFMLQQNRDLLEANEIIDWKNVTFDINFPKLDAIFLEYRWEIPGRNCQVETTNPKYTPDFNRQKELLKYYQERNIPILIWDKDQKINNDAQIPKKSVIFDPAIKPKLGRNKLLFPIDTGLSKKALTKLKDYQSSKRMFDLVYVGNQYERDHSFKKYIDIPAIRLKNSVNVFGSWNKYHDKFEQNKIKYPNVFFKGRILYKEVNNVYNQSFATVLLAPDRYYKTGQLTQRIFESLWGHCIPLMPHEYQYLNDVIDEDFIVSSSDDVVKKIRYLRKLKDSIIVQKLESQILKLLDLFSVQDQVKKIYQAISEA